ISQFDIENTLRFNNGLTLLTVTAGELLAIIEHGVSESEPGATPGRFPQVGGMRFSFDPSFPANARVRSMAIVDDAGAIIDTVVMDGAVVGDPARTFRIVTLGFLAGGGDGYPFPTTGRIDLEDEGLPDSKITFAPAGSEQHALALFLRDVFPAETPFDSAEVGPDMDTRIQDLSQRTDTVLDD
ncbi:MAG: 5'-nucleotidase, partial [Myxococcota bacterium]